MLGFEYRFAPDKRIVDLLSFGVNIHDVEVNLVPIMSKNRDNDFKIILSVIR